MEHLRWLLLEISIRDLTVDDRKNVPSNIYLFKVNNKNTRTKSLTSSGASIVNFEYISQFFSTISVDDFEQANVSWG